MQNEQTFQDLVNLQIGLRTSKEGMKQHSNVAVYLRCSTDDQTVDAQRMSLNPFLQMNGFNIDECELYIDEGVSAKKFPSFTDRPEGSRLMKDIEEVEDRIEVLERQVKVLLEVHKNTLKAFREMIAAVTEISKEPSEE